MRTRLTAVLVFTSSLTATAGDWTEFRGPQGDGHSTAINLPRQWSETENVTWKSAIEGTGWSSPVTAGDQIFLTTAVPVAEEDRHDLKVVCLSAADGQRIWTTTVFQQDDGAVEMHRKNSPASATPIVEGDFLYVHFGSQGTACLDLSGKVIWKNDTLKYKSQHGNGGCPAIAQQTMIICCDGRDARFVVGLDKTTGRQIWRTERELSPSRGFSFCTPTLIKVDGQWQAVCPGSGGVWAYDPATGRQIWRVAYGEGYSVVPRPIFAHGLIYVCSGFGDSQVFAIDPSGTGDITQTHVKWQSKKGIPKSPSLLIVGQELYMVDDRGIASCRDALSGEIHWQERFPGAFSASPSFADGVIYFQNETGETTVIKPGQTFQLVGRNSLGDGKLRTFASFAFIDNSILLRNETYVYRLTK
ncbi:MAG: PQQ-like beta-propeller repeat protein [Planctomycetaceae bacterium]|nr:PQQ-like beta-propeller repeat protein [Planctomycetaceae bacterium]